MPRNKVAYEWVIETVDEYEDIINSDHYSENERPLCDLEDNY